ncbi:glycosyl-phosphatidylinositol-anchored molecule-like protein [Molossus molossus]|uniref:glycosyl-phosphatidylinositol-anchored molecule-like protein n=1 Tax=Molossus molossus TaxID=27622 RepID=UPI001746F6E2|nr:glycosyl-phosphatidylinositol-anchored molecule-like protein [Molossus molossus]
MELLVPWLRPGSRSRPDSIPGRAAPRASGRPGAGVDVPGEQGPTLVPPGTYDVKCYECTIINSFRCTNLRVCKYETRRCFTLSVRLNPRELMVFKNCTDNCTFVYKEHQPPPATISRSLRTNSFYWINCCGGMTCNDGGPSNVERDIVPPEPIEEEIESAAVLWSSGLFLTFASTLVGRTLT